MQETALGLAGYDEYAVQWSLWMGLCSGWEVSRRRSEEARSGYRTTTDIARHAAHPATWRERDYIALAGLGMHAALVIVCRARVMVESALFVTKLNGASVSPFSLVPLS